MATLANTISTFVPSQVPRYINDNYPNFVALLQQYFQFLENTTYNGTVYQIRNLINYKEIDSTTPEFYQYFINEFLPFFPNETAYSLQKLLKVATQFYQTKGSRNSIEFLFRVLYGLDSEIYYPKNNVLRLSAGNWNLPQAIKLTLTGSNIGFNIGLLVGHQGIGSKSNTTCMIENAFVTIDPTLNQEIVEVFLSNISDQFTPGENFNVIYGFAANGAPLIFSEPIIGSLSEIIVDPHNEGLSYVGTQFYPNGAISFQGDPVSIIGGLGGSNLDIQAIAFVGNVTQGSVTGVTVDAGGYGYSVYPNTLCTVVDAPGDTGVGANIIVSQVDTANQVQLILNRDSIEFKMNVTIGATNYNFANTVNANLAQTFSNALTYYPVNVAPLKQLSVINGGTNFRQTPTISLRSMYDSDFSSSLFAVYQANPTTANFNNWITARPNIADLGIMAAAQILTQGSGYSATKDALYVDSMVGGGATYVLTVGGSGQITASLVSNGGYGYYSYGNPTMPQLFLANSVNPANAASGSGATFKAWGFNQGQILTLSVSEIGQVLDIRLVNRGFDYVQTPLVSLRNMDVVVKPIGSNQLYFQGDFIFQGANANVATFTANVDEFNRTTNTLRLYNYIGSINVSANLVGANFNATPLTANVYGDGKAKANAQFLGGLIDFPGFWLGTAGFLSADQKFQDNVQYHNYSYLVKVEKDLSSYQQTVQNIVHPAGTKMLGLCTVTDDNRPKHDSSFAESIQIANTTNLTGNVSLSFSTVGYGAVTGHGTQFVGNINVGDIMMIANTDPVRQECKSVINVASATVLNVDSNAVRFVYNAIATALNSNTITYNNTTMNLIVGDILQTNIGGNAQTSIVQTVLSNTSVNVNTVFNITNTNVSVMWYLSLINVSYDWFNPA